MHLRLSKLFCVSLQLDPAERLEELEGKVAQEETWGASLARVEEGLQAGRRWLWDEASRKVGVLLSSPAAFEGEHFLQVR